MTASSGSTSCYLEVTEAVAADRAGWQDWPFLQQFDVVFARLYFDAIVSWERQPAGTAHAWRPVFRARHDRKLARIQFALAGMNAHINHDLPVALGRLAEPDGRYPSRDGVRYRDFSRVNDILERVEGSVVTVLATGLLGEIEQALGNLDSVLAMWKVRKAREAAWTNGEVLWHLRVDAAAAPGVPGEARFADRIRQPRPAPPHPRSRRGRSRRGPPGCPTVNRERPTATRRSRFTVRHRKSPEVAGLSDTGSRRKSDAEVGRRNRKSPG